VVAVVDEEEVATTISMAVVLLTVAKKLFAHGSRATPRSNATRYALKRVMLLMNVGIASMRILYQMISTFVLPTTPTMLTQIGTLIPVHLTISQST
jgi:hypothetical protein